MHSNLEIELKTLISKDKYDELIKIFDLENNIYIQTNHYFDTTDLTLQKSKTVLRIRQKANNSKLTSKCHANSGAFETHLFLSKDEMNEMIKNGFDASLINLEGYVYKQCELTTHRCKTPYKNGTLYFDKSSYYGTEDYEIEFESDTLEECETDFKSFLEQYSIPLNPVDSKCTRAFKAVKKQTSN